MVLGAFVFQTRGMIAATQHSSYTAAPALLPGASARGTEVEALFRPAKLSSWLRMVAYMSISLHPPSSSRTGGKQCSRNIAAAVRVWGYVVEAFCLVVDDCYDICVQQKNLI